MKKIPITRPNFVSRDVGLNPVTMAVFRKRFAAWILDTKIRAYMLTSGENCEDLFEEGSFIFAVLAAAAVDQGITLADIPELQALDKAMAAFSAMSHTGVWDGGRLMDVVEGLNGAHALISQLSASTLSRAVKVVVAARFEEKVKVLKS
jgi:hypothetical protein